MGDKEQPQIPFMATRAQLSRGHGGMWQNPPPAPGRRCGLESQRLRARASVSCDPPREGLPHPRAPCHSVHPDREPVCFCVCVWWGRLCVFSRPPLGCGRARIRCVTDTQTQLLAHGAPVWPGWPAGAPGITEGGGGGRSVLGFHCRPQAQAGYTELPRGGDTLWAETPEGQVWGHHGQRR